MEALRTRAGFWAALLGELDGYWLELRCGPERCGKASLVPLRMLAQLRFELRRAVGPWTFCPRAKSRTLDSQPLRRPSDNPAMEITVIDQRSSPGPLWTVGKFAGPIARVTNPGAVPMRNVSSMVHGVIKRLGGAKLTRLNIIDHGNEKGFELGDDLVTAESIGQHSRQLGLLKGRFAADGFVHLQHCKVGQDRLLLLMLSSIVGAKVYAGTGLDLFGANLGSYTGCQAPSACDSQFFRP